MSRVAKNPVVLPSDVKLTRNGNQIIIEGSQGRLEWVMSHFIQLIEDEHGITFAPVVDEKQENQSPNAWALAGTARALLNNMVIGVSDGFKKDLEIVGVGYQASVQGSRLKLQLGYSHDIFFDFPDGITIEADRTAISVKGNDKQLVGSVASKIRSFRKPEPYKGKGVRYKDEYIRIKQGKTVGE